MKHLPFSDSYLYITHGLRLLSCAALLSASPVFAQSPAFAQLNPDELQELLAPIALYPDALTALILPASTVPYDVVLGARYLDTQGDPNAAQNMPWDDSVKALIRYPDVLQWMNENLEWTAAVGEAFVDQPADVMNAIQSLRAKARAAGNLVDTPQQHVVVEREVIRIIPVEREVIYVPRYDPEVVYIRRSPSLSPLITFGAGLAVGAWLSNDFDWENRRVYRGNWRGWNDNGRDWNDGQPNVNVINNNVNVVNIDSSNATAWQPSERSRRELQQRQENNTGNARLVSESARKARVAARERARVDGANNNPVIASSALPAAGSRLPRPNKIKAAERNATEANSSAPKPTATPETGRKDQSIGKQKPVTTEPKPERVRPPTQGAPTPLISPAQTTLSNNGKKKEQNLPAEPKNRPSATPAQSPPAAVPEVNALPKNQPRPVPAAPTPPRENPSKAERPINSESSPKNDRKIPKQPAPSAVNREQQPVPQSNPTPPASRPKQNPAQQPAGDRKKQAEPSQQRKQPNPAPPQRPKAEQPKPQPSTPKTESSERANPKKQPQQQQAQQKQKPQQPQQPSQVPKKKKQPIKDPATQDEPKDPKN